MNTRELVLDAVRRHQPAGRPLPQVPRFTSPPQDLLARFTAALERMGGAIAEPPPGMALAVFIRHRFPQARVCCSATPEVHGNRELATVIHPRDLEDVDVAIVRAAFGVAETGSVWLSERELRINAMGFLSQHLVVLLDPRAIVEGLQDAYRQPGFREARYSVLMTGPSATADIEGVLVRGAQGIRSLTVIPMA